MSSVLKPGRNCWRIAQASRFALLVDGSAYYEAVAEAIEQAKRTVFIVGWDLDSRVRLGAADGPGERVPALRDFLPAVAARNPDLNIYILSWDFPLLFAKRCSDTDAVTSDSIIATRTIGCCLSTDQIASLIAVACDETSPSPRTTSHSGLSAKYHWVVGR